MNAKRIVTKKLDAFGNELEEVILVADERTLGYGVSGYARIFDSSCPAWSKNLDETKFWLIHTQQYANCVLKAKGQLYLNNVYEMLGLTRIEEFESVGWRYNEKNPVGDNFVDFDIFSIVTNCNRDFLTGKRDFAVLDFNVDGCIGKKS